jgi:hypothetical protein
MKLQFIIYFLPVLLSCSGSDSPRQAKQVHNKIDTKCSVKNKPPSSFSDTIKINFPSAVFYNPDSLQLEQIKAITDSVIFDGTMHDCFYQMRNARAVLKQYYPGIKITEVKNVRYLLFEKKGGEREYIDLNTKNDPCGIFLFDSKRNAKQADMTNIESELGLYFSK